MSRKHKRQHQRAAALAALTTFLTLSMMFNLIITTGLFPGADKEVDENTHILERSAERRLTVEGIFTDRSGEAITEAGEQGSTGQVLFDECYSYIIGYQNAIYGKTGLRRTLYDHLYYGGEDNQGALIQLTTDNELQQHCYKALDGDEGSIIVMKAETGELLALASHSKGIDYNVNDILTPISAEEAEAGGVDLSQFNDWYDFNGDGIADRDDGVRKFMLYNAQPSGFWLNTSVTSEDPPGSTFKILTAASLIEHGKGNYTYQDSNGTYEIEKDKVVNFGDDSGPYAYGTVDMEKALVKSVNVYFASAAVEMGGKALWDTAEKFLLTRELALDFTTLKPVFSKNILSNDRELAHTAYGQGLTQVSPLHVVMMMDAVMNDGKIMQPYLVQAITDEGKVQHNTQPVVASQAMEPETAATLREYLHATALGYGLDEKSYGTVYAKTGSAELGDDTNHAYFLAGVQDTAWGDLVILVDKAHVDLRGRGLQDILENILSYVLTQ